MRYLVSSSILILWINILTRRLNVSLDFVIFSSLPKVHVAGAQIVDSYSLMFILFLSEMRCL